MKDTAVKTLRLLFSSFFPSFIFLLIFISSLFASLFIFPIHLFLLLLYYESAAQYSATLQARRDLTHGPLLDMAHSAVSWLWLDYVHSGNATSPGGLKLSWQPPLNDRATNWRLGVPGWWAVGTGEVRRDPPRRYSNFTCRTARLFNYPIRGQPAPFPVHTSQYSYKRKWCKSYSRTMQLRHIPHPTFNT